MFGTKFCIIKRGIENICGICFKLHMMGISIKRVLYVYSENMSVITNVIASLSWHSRGNWTWLFTVSWKLVKPFLPTSQPRRNWLTCSQRSCMVRLGSFWWTRCLGCVSPVNKWLSCLLCLVELMTGPHDGAITGIESWVQISLMCWQLWFYKICQCEYPSNLWGLIKIWGSGEIILAKNEITACGFMHIEQMVTFLLHIPAFSCKRVRSLDLMICY